MDCEEEQELIKKFINHVNNTSNENIVDIIDVINSGVVNGDRLNEENNKVLDLNW